jgi:hypothetical protein
MRAVRVQSQELRAVAVARHLIASEARPFGGSALVAGSVVVVGASL